MKINRRGVLAGVAGVAGAPAAWAQTAPPLRPRSIERRLVELGIELPSPPQPVATYAPFRRVGDVIYLAGLGPARAPLGRLGAELSVEEGYAAARSAGLNAIALLRSVCGSLDRVQHCVRVGVFVASADDFTQQPQVANGASDLFVEIFGEAGLHARTAVGVNVLPFGIAVEVESVWRARR